MGSVVKIVSADVLKIDNALGYIHYVWLGPFQILFTFVMIYFVIGWPSLLALAFLLLAIPVQAWLTSLLIHNRKVSSFPLNHASRKLFVVDDWRGY